MPRGARQKSSTEIYHVMLRGINRQNIFEDEEDCRRFLKVLKECKDISGFELYAYCLMTNHIHLLIKCGNEPLELVFKRLGSRYVYWYNLKYNRVGHLFQDRYKSETVEDDPYFLTVLRYILQNPMKAGMESTPGSYVWSSYDSYIGKPDCLTDVGFAIGMFQSSDAMIRFLNQRNDDRALELSDRHEGVTDEQAAEIIRRVTGCRSIAEFQAIEKKKQKEFAAELREQKLSLGQISRMTGMSKATVYRAIE